MTGELNSFSIGAFKGTKRKRNKQEAEPRKAKDKRRVCIRCQILHEKVSIKTGVRIPGSGLC